MTYQELLHKLSKVTPKQIAEHLKTSNFSAAVKTLEEQFTEFNQEMKTRSEIENTPSYKKRKYSAGPLKDKLLTEMLNAALGIQKYLTGVVDRLELFEQVRNIIKEICKQISSVESIGKNNKEHYKLLEQQAETLITSVTAENLIAYITAGEHAIKYYQLASKHVKKLFNTTSNKIQRQREVLHNKISIIIGKQLELSIQSHRSDLVARTTKTLIEFFNRILFSMKDPDCPYQQRIFYLTYFGDCEKTLESFLIPPGAIEKAALLDLIGQLKRSIKELSTLSDAKGKMSMPPLESHESIVKQENSSASSDTESSSSSSSEDSKELKESSDTRSGIIYQDKRKRPAPKRPRDLDGDGEGEDEGVLNPHDTEDDEPLDSRLRKRLKNKTSDLRTSTLVSASTAGQPDPHDDESTRPADDAGNADDDDDTRPQYSDDLPDPTDPTSSAAHTASASATTHATPVSTAVPSSATTHAASTSVAVPASSTAHAASASTSTAIHSPSTTTHAVPTSAADRAESAVNSDLVGHLEIPRSLSSDPFINRCLTNSELESLKGFDSISSASSLSFLSSRSLSSSSLSSSSLSSSAQKAKKIISILNGALHKDPISCANLALLYLHKIIPGNYKLAIEQLNEAITQNTPEAMEILAKVYTHSLEGVTFLEPITRLHIEQVLDLYQKLANNFKKIEYYNELGKIYRDGYGSFIPKDEARALTYFQIAADQNNFLAIKHLADLRFLGTTEIRNYSIALKLYEKLERFFGQNVSSEKEACLSQIRKLQQQKEEALLLVKHYDKLLGVPEESLSMGVSSAENRLSPGSVLSPGSRGSASSSDSSASTSVLLSSASRRLSSLTWREASSLGGGGLPRVSPSMTSTSSSSSSSSSTTMP